MTQRPYHIKISPSAHRQLNVLHIKQQKIIIKLLEALAINPRPPGAKKIEGMTGLYSEDIEQFELVYKIEEQDILLLLIR